MLKLRFFALVLLALSILPRLPAQRDQPQTLTDAQQQAIADAGIDPPARIKLYIKYLNESADTIKQLVSRSEAGRGRRIDAELNRFSALVDELASNLDEYGGRMADLRPALKPLADSIARWQDILHKLPNDPMYEISQQDATDSVSDLASQAKQLTATQEAYFKAHKNAKGQQREEPQ